MLAFDIDVRHGGSEAALEAAFGCKVPETLKAWSGRNDGGCHLYFMKPDREISQRQLPKGVDLRTGGKHYLIAPPSLHPSTGNPNAGHPPPVVDPPPPPVPHRPPPKPKLQPPAPAV